jgi:TonB family protein
MAAVATGVLGIGRFLITSTPTPTTTTTLSPTTTLPGSGAGGVTPEATLPATTTTIPVTTTVPPRKALGTNTTLATTTTTVATTTTTTTTVPTTTTTTTIPATTTTTLPPPPPPLKSPECLKCLPPDYPHIAQRLQREGTVELRIQVDEGGRVVEVRVLKAVEHLTDAAVRAVRTRIYKPATRGGVPEAAWVEVAIEFKLQN